MHITQRGNDRIPIFRDAADRAQFRDLLHGTSMTEGCAIHAYAFMTNHIHLVVTPSDPIGVSRMMQRLGRRYVRYFNVRHDRTGTLYEGRFKSALIDSAAYMLTCLRYIELNPVRAGLVVNPADYAWSSFRCLARGAADRLVTPHAEYLRLGRTAAQRRQAYGELCTESPDERLAACIRRETARGAVIGGAAFVEALEASLRRRVRKHAHGGNRRYIPPPHDGTSVQEL
jgi:putative transposase